MPMNLFNPPPLGILVSWLAWILLHTLWQGMLIACFLGIVLRTIDEKRSRLRYSLACAGLFLLTLAPVMTGFLTSNHLRTAQPISRTSAVIGVNETSPSRGNDTANDSAASTIPESQRSLLPSDDDQPVTPVADGISWNALKNMVRNLVDRSAGWLVSLWLLGVAVSAGRLGVSFQAVRNLRRSATPVTDSAVILVFNCLLQRLKLSPAVRLLESPSVAVPAVLGWIRPIVLFPLAYSSRLTIHQVEALLAHELAHIARHDYIVNLLQTFTETVLFYHPAVWWISKTIRNEREHCCDAIAVNLIADRELYANSLFELAQMVAPPQLSLSASGGQLTNRIRRILGVQPKASSTSGPVAALASAFLLTLCISALTLSKVGADDPVEPKNTSENHALTAAQPAKEVVDKPTETSLPPLRLTQHGTGAGGAEYFNLVQFPAIQTELGLDDVAVAKINETCLQFRKELIEGLPARGIRNRTEMRREAGRMIQSVIQEPTRDGMPVFKATVARFRPKLKEFLTPEQYTRLQQIVWQEIGIAALADDDLIAELMITQEQKDKIADINDEYFLKREQVPNARARITPPSLVAINAELSTKIMDTLPKDLQERLTTLKGKPFDLFQLREQETRRRTLRLIGSGRLSRMLFIAETKGGQEDLGLSVEEAAKVNGLVDEFRQAIISFDDVLPSDASDEQKKSHQEKQKKVVELNNATADKYYSQLKDLLTNNQITRIQEIYWQDLRDRALNDPELIKELPLSKELQDKIKSIRHEYEEKQTQLLAGSSAIRRTADEALAALKNEQQEKIEVVLTQAQRDRFAALLGTEFRLSLDAKLHQATNVQMQGQERLRDRLPMRGLPAGTRSYGIATRPRRPLFALIESDAVQKELGVTSEQIEKIKMFSSEVRTAAQQAIGELPDLGRISLEEGTKIKEQIEKTDRDVTERFLPKLKEILTTEQFNRFKQVNWHLMGFEALKDSEIIEAISLTKDQQENLAASFAEGATQSGHQEILSSVTINSIVVRLVTSETPQLRILNEERVRNALSQRQSKVDAILTNEQQKKLAALKGKAFDRIQLQR